MIQAKRGRKVIPDLLEMLALLAPEDLRVLLDRLGSEGLLEMLALTDPKATLEERVLRVRPDQRETLAMPGRREAWDRLARLG